MKMGVGTRIVYSLFMILIIAVCLLVILAALGVFPAQAVEALIGGFINTGYKYVWVAVAAVLVIVAVPLLFFGSKKAAVPTSVLLSESVDGSVSVTIGALKELASRYLNEVYGIITQNIEIRPLSDRQVRVNLYLSTKPDVEVPEITKTVTDGIKEYIEKYSGISATYVGIKIMPVKNNQSPTR